jgi:hypothetical protein
VPFWRHGFLPLPLTSARFLVACVPRRSAAFARTTDSHIRSVLTRPPNTSSRTSTAPTFSFWLFTMSSCMGYFFPFFGFSTCATLIFLAVIALRTIT